MGVGRGADDSTESLRARLNALYREVRTPTYAQLEAHAAHLGRKLATSTTGTLLTGSGKPRWDTLETFVLACRRHASTRRLPVPDTRFDLAVWREYHEHIRTSSKPGIPASVRRESYNPMINALERKHLPGLRNRNRELDELTKLIAKRAGYLVVEAPMYAGKTALFTALRRKLVTAGFEVITFFIVRGAEDTSAVFLPKVITQLLEIGERTDPRLAAESLSDTIDGRRTQFAALWERQAQTPGRPLVLLLDALDEQHTDGASDSPPIGHLLPMSAGPFGRVVVSSRLNPRYESGVPAHHPLANLSSDRVYLLSPSEYARVHREKVQRDLDDFLASGDRLAEPLAGMYALAPTAMSDYDLADLFHHSGLAPFSPGRVISLRQRIASSLLTATDGGVTSFTLGHDVLRTYVVERLGSTGVHHLLSQVATWAAHYARQSWPANTPVFLRDHLPRFAHAVGGPDAAALLVDLVSAERRTMHLRTDRHLATFHDTINTALDALESTSPTADGLADYFRVLFHSTRTTSDSALVPLPVLQALVLTGQTAQAWGIALTLPPTHRDEGQKEVVTALAQAGKVELVLTFAADIADIGMRAEALAEAASQLLDIDLTDHAEQIANLAEHLAAAESTPGWPQVRVVSTVARVRATANGGLGTRRAARQITRAISDAATSVRHVKHAEDTPHLKVFREANSRAAAAGALAFLGDLQSALLQTLLAAGPPDLTFPQGRRRALAEVGASLAAAGKIDDAIRVAHNTNDALDQATVLAAAATTLAVSAPEDAYTIAIQAKQLTDRITESRRRTEALLQVAQAMAAAGRHDDTERLADQVKPGDARGKILGYAMSAFAAAGETTDALRVAHAIQRAPDDHGGPRNCASAIGAAATQLASIGAIDTARQLTEQALALAAQQSLTDSDEIPALCAVASALAHAGHLGQAAKLAEQVLAAALRTESFPWEVGAAAATLVATGHIEKATAMEEIPRPFFRDFMLIGMAEELARTGQADLALAVIPRVTESHRLYAIQRVATRFAEQEQHDKLDETVRDYLHLVSTHGDATDQGSYIAQLATALPHLPHWQSAADIAAAVPHPAQRVEALAAVAAASGDSQLVEQAILAAEDTTLVDSRVHALGTIANRTNNKTLAEQAGHMCLGHAIDITYLIPAVTALSRFHRDNLVLRIVDNLNDPHQRVRLLAHAAEALAQTGAHDQACHLVELALRETTNIDNPPYHAEAFGIVAEAFVLVGQPTRSADMIDQASDPDLVDGALQRLVSGSARVRLGNDLVVIMRLLHHVRTVRNTQTARRLTAQLYACRMLAMPASSRLADAWL